VTILDQLIVAAFVCYVVVVGLRDRRLAAILKGLDAARKP